MGLGDAFVNSTSRKTLRIIGTVGEPINPEAWKWYYEVVGEGIVQLLIHGGKLKLVNTNFSNLRCNTIKTWFCNTPILWCKTIDT